MQDRPYKISFFTYIHKLTNDLVLYHQVHNLIVPVKCDHKDQALDHPSDVSQELPYQISLSLLLMTDIFLSTCSVHHL